VPCDFFARAQPEEVGSSTRSRLAASAITCKVVSSTSWNVITAFAAVVVGMLAAEEKKCSIGVAAGCFGWSTICSFATMMSPCWRVGFVQERSNCSHFAHLGSFGSKTVFV